jgi:cell division protein FtsZ
MVSASGDRGGVMPDNWRKWESSLATRISHGSGILPDTTNGFGDPLRCRYDLRRISPAHRGARDAPKVLAPPIPGPSSQDGDLACKKRQKISVFRQGVGTILCGENFMIEFDDETDSQKGPVIKVVGVGGGGGNAINTMIEAGIDGVDFIVANTDCQVLEANQATIKIHLGKNLTKGLGAGANPEIGRAAAMEDAGRVAECLAGSDMVFVTAGMGGGTGTGAAPVIAQVARDLGALTVGVVTKPFVFEGSQRRSKAAGGIAELAKCVDALIVIPNDRLITLAGMKMTLKDAFAMVDNVLLNAVRGISDLVMVPGLINVDFADVRTIMTGMGRALMGSGRGKGDKRALEAAQQAISSPLLEDVSINGATGILINITGGPDLTLSEVTEAATLIEEAADPGANIIFGSVIDANAGDEVRITVIATGFQPSMQEYGLPLPTRGGVQGGMHRRHGTDQMALPMSATGAAASMGAIPRAASAASSPAAFGTGQAQPQAGSYPIAAAGFGPSAGAGHGIPANVGGGTGTLVWHPMTAASTVASPAPSSAATRFTPPSGFAIGTTEVVAEPAGFMEEDLDVSAFQGLGVGQPGGNGFANGMQAAPSSLEWAASAERPVIRPPISVNPGLRARPAATMSRVSGGSNELGVEESEFDRPTFIRRGIIPPG